MTGERRSRKDEATENRAVEAAKEAVKRNGKREPQEEDTPEDEQPQTQKLVVDGTDG